LESKDSVFYKAGPELCTATVAVAQLPLKRGVGAVREYRLWSRRARERLDGHPRSSSPGYETHVRGSVQPSDSRAGARIDTTVRRRRALELVIAVIAVPALVALATGSSTAWWVFLGMLPLFCVYLGVVFYARRLRAEQEINVAFFGNSRGAAAGLEDVFAGSTSALDEISA
jgi:hypothetical protein